MLEAQDRRPLTEALRPPPSYRLDWAVATTFSLDLLALLTTPLTFALFDWQADEQAEPDLLALLEASRRYADRISVFCQAGQIGIPKPEQPLYPYVEGSVFEVTAPTPGGVFHPKLWLLRWVSDDAPTRYRLLCLSRNLTFDRSWDSVLVLEGQLTDRKNAIAANHPLADLVQALPTLAIRDVPELVWEKVEQIQDEVRRVKWDLPEGFDAMRFWSLGIPGHGRRWPLAGDIRRMLVVSPFVGDAFLRTLTGDRTTDTLVSRLEDIQRIDLATLRRFSEVLVLDDHADLDARSADLDDASDGEGQLGASEDDVGLRGLHAKVYVADAGWKARVWIGSANATSQAFQANVEFLVEMEGRKSRCGIESMLGHQKGVTTFRDLLKPFPEGDPVEIDEAQEALERQVDGFRYELARANLRAKVSRARAERFLVQVQVSDGRLPAIPGGLAVRCWPIRIQGAVHGSPVTRRAGTIAKFDLAKEEVTSFFAFEVVARADNRQALARFTLNLPLEGAPEDRRETIVRSLLSDREKVLRFLLFLLADGHLQEASGLLLDSVDGVPDSYGDRPGLGASLFESLLRALERDPGKVDEVGRLVQELRSTDGPDVLPAGFEEIWRPINEAREALR